MMICQKLFGNFPNTNNKLIDFFLYNTITYFFFLRITKSINDSTLELMIYNLKLNKFLKFNNLLFK